MIGLQITIGILSAIMIVLILALCRCAKKEYPEMTGKDRVRKFINKKATE